MRSAKLLRERIVCSISSWRLTSSALAKLSFAATVKQTDTGSFERLRQVDRIRELRKLNLIDDAVKQHFDSLRHIRSKYLHFLSQSHDRVAPDAKLAYEAALKTVGFVLQVDFREGAVVLQKDLVAYLVRKGVLAGR